MNIDKSLYQEFLRQKQFIEALSPTDDDLHRLFFQDQVIEQLSPNEQESYMLFLLGSRPEDSDQIAAFHRFKITHFRRSSGVMQGLRHWWNAHFPRWSSG